MEAARLDTARPAARLVDGRAPDEDVGGHDCSRLCWRPARRLPLHEARRPRLRAGMTKCV
jgi:hypothetical protein